MSPYTLVPFCYTCPWFIILVLVILHISIHGPLFLISERFTAHFFFHLHSFTQPNFIYTWKLPSAASNFLFSHRATHLNNGGVQVPYSRTSVAMAVGDEESVLYLIPHLKHPSRVGIWIYIWQRVCRFFIWCKGITSWTFCQSCLVNGMLLT